MTLEKLIISSLPILKPQWNYNIQPNNLRLTIESRIDGDCLCIYNQAKDIMGNVYYEKPDFFEEYMGDVDLDKLSEKIRKAKFSKESSLEEIEETILIEDLGDFYIVYEVGNTLEIESQHPTLYTAKETFDEEIDDLPVDAFIIKRVANK